MERNLKALWGSVLTVVAVGAISGLVMAIISIVTMAPQLGHYPAFGELVAECAAFISGASVISLVIALGFCAGIALPFHLAMRRLRIHSFISYFIAGFVCAVIFLMIEFGCFKPTTNQRSMFEYLGATALVAGPLAAIVFWNIAAGGTEIKSKLLRIFIPYVIVLVLFSSAYKELENESLLHPKLFASNRLPKWMAMQGKRDGVNLSGEDCVVVNNWIVSHQSDWEPATLNDYHPKGDTQIFCGNYDLADEGNYVVVGYYRNENDMENDDDSEIKVKRPITADEQLFWRQQIDHFLSIHAGEIPWYKKDRSPEVIAAQQNENPAVIAEQQGEARMAAAMPDFFRPLLENYLDPSSIMENPYIQKPEMHERRLMNLKPFHEALETKYPTRSDQILILIKWEGTSRRLGSMASQYDILVDELLLDYSTDDIIKVLNDNPLDDGEADAAALFFAYNVKYARPQDLHLLPPKLKKLFLSRAMLSDDRDLKKRAQDAFGK